MSAVLDQKLRKALELRTDTPAMLDALESMSSFWETNTLEARRGLRQQLENQNIQLAEDFISSFSPLQERINKVESDVLKLEGSCGLVAHRLREAETAMYQFTERATVLSERKVGLEAQANAVEIFLSKYSLTEDELSALKGAPLDGASVNSDNKSNASNFFDALNRLVLVREECCRLVGSRHQSAAFELLEVLSQQQESAYERIYHWVHDRLALMESCVEGPGVGGESMMETYMCDPVLVQALRALRARPEFLSHCAESLGSIRRSWLLRRFVLALTVGTGRRPMELASHDAGRYVSDMLAWVHEAIASEKDFLDHLFENGQVFSNESSSTLAVKDSLMDDGDDEFEDKMVDDSIKNLKLADATEMLHHVVEGLARPLRVRLQGVIETQLREGVDGTHQRGNALVVTLRLHGLISFYRFTLWKLLHGGGKDKSKPPAPPSTIESVLSECAHSSKKAFSQLLDVYSASISRTSTVYPLDLSAAAIMEHIKRLTELLTVEADSFLSANDWTDISSLPSNSVESPDITKGKDDIKDVKLIPQDMDVVLTSILEPLLGLCRTSADGRLDQTDTAILMINNASAMRASIEPFTVSSAPVGRWTKLLSDEIATWMSVLVKQEAEAVLESSGLSELLRMIQAMASQVGTASEMPGLDVTSVGAVMRRFYASLFQIVMPTLDRLIPMDERSEARRSIALNIADSHATVHAFVSNPKNGYNDTSFLLHSPEQVRMLLDCN
jgi:conserved oligomeric Golgi complex subunit 6